MCAHVVVAGRARTRKRRRNVSALARWGKAFRFAPAGRGGVERSWGVKEAEEEEEEKERSLGVDRRSERIKREAIRECLMPRTKLCNYLYVRLRPSWLARVRALACTCDAYVDAICGGASCTCTRVRAIRECARARKSTRSRLRHLRMWEYTCATVRVCVYVPKIHIMARISRPKPTSGIYHGLLSCLCLPLAARLSRQTMPRLLEYNDYYHLPPRIVLQ